MFVQNQQKLFKLIYFCLLGVSLFTIYQQYTKLAKNPRRYIQEGKIDSCCCEFSTLQNTNNKLYPVIQDLTKTKFFRIYKTYLNNDCPFWAAQLVCMTTECPVKECDCNEVPQHWEKTDLIVKEELLTEIKHKKSKEKPKKDILNDLIGWKIGDADDDESNETSYVDLVKNAESNTGFIGKNIWPVIYQENCFRKNEIEKPKLCKEEILFNRLISGLHTSINTHVFEFFERQFENDTFVGFKSNVSLFMEKVAPYNDRINNLYFSYAVLLRAVNVAFSHINNFNITSDDPESDKLAKEILANFTQVTGKTCSQPLQEFEYKYQTFQEIKNRVNVFTRNISKVMDCIECEKCKMNGKLAIEGIGTAFKILFSENQKEEIISMKRNEFIALINTLQKFSTAIKSIDTMFERNYQIKYQQFIKVIKQLFYLNASMLVFLFLSIKGLKHVEAKLKKD